MDPDVLFVDEGHILTSAGVASGVDLCLHIVRRDHGMEVANTVARALRRTRRGATVAKLSTSDAPWPTSLRNRLPTLGTGPSNISTTRSPWRTWRRAPT